MNILLILPGFILAIFIVVMYEIKLRKQENKVKLQNKVHFYLARDRNGELLLYMGKPFIGINQFHPCQNGCIITSDDDLSNFGLNKDDYADLKWEDEPVEVFINMED